MKKINLLAFGLAICVLSGCDQQQSTLNEKDRIKPYTENPGYWQYKGKPVLLLGATDNVNLFQISHLESHLDSLKACGGNYIRNGMNDGGPGNVRKYAKNADDKYDLTQWNDEYWKKFENTLKLATERDIIVQVEVWDRFNHSRGAWTNDPYNPKNNINYTFAETGFDSLYPLHPGANVHPFFFSVPELDNNETLLTYQKAYVIKLLSISLEYGNVLYCLDNETSGEEAWATFWAEFIRENSQGKDINITEMWDNWDVKSDRHKRTLDHPERYQYIDISQNSQIPGYENWENAQYVFNYIKDNPRPVNSTKIYGCDTHEPWLSRGMTTEHAVQTFCRNILGGFASSRFHRPPHGLGLSQHSINSIKTIRKIEELVKMWDIEPRMDLLTDVEENEAYLSANEGKYYLVFFTNGGKVNLDLSNYHDQFNIRWITIEDAEWGETTVIKGGSNVALQPVDDKACFALVMKK